MLEQSAFESIAGSHLSRLQELLRRVNVESLFRAHARLCAVRDAGHTVYVAGNGGSAATASHWANDLGKAASRSGRRPIRVLSLTDNTSWFTALANDEGYEAVFARQLENFSQRGDLLIVISASGNSPNLVRAVETARSRGVAILALLGFDGGALAKLADDSVLVGTEAGAYELVEDAHMVLCHALTRSLIADVPEAVSAPLGKNVQPVSLPSND